MECIFCKIVRKEIPSFSVYEDDHSLAFLDINPVSKGHTLLIPKIHSPHLVETEDKVLAGLLPLVKKVAPAIQEAVGAKGFNLHINTQVAAGQVVFHLHLHIIPRFEKDSIKMWRGSPYGEGEAEKVQKVIKEHIEGN